MQLLRITENGVSISSKGYIDEDNMEEDIEAEVRRAAEYAGSVYKEISGGIRESSRVVVLTTGWVRSPGCSAVHAISSVLGRVEAHHIDLTSFSRYVAPYRSALSEEEVEGVWLIVYGNPLEPWRSTADRLVKSLSMLGYRGVMIRAGEPKGQADLGGIRAINVPSGVDPILAYHIATLKAVLEVAGRENPSPRVARLAGEVEDLTSVLPSMLERYSARLREIAGRASKGVLTIIVTCASRSFAEGLIIDGYSLVRVYDASELHSPAPLEGGVALLYTEAERDLIPQTLIPREGVDLMLRTDPITSPIYYRILSIATSKILREERQGVDLQG